MSAHERVEQALARGETALRSAQARCSPPPGPGGGRARATRLRKALEAAALRTVATVVVGLLRCTSLRLGVAVYWHGAGDPPTRPQEALLPAIGERLLDAQLQTVARMFAPVHAVELLNAVAARRRWQPFPVALTFDDDLASHHDVAMPLLRAAGAPATFFLNGASLDGPYRFWWDRLDRLPDRDLPARVKRMSRGERRSWESELARRAGPDPATAGLRRPHVRALAQAGHEIGFHTLRHDPLPTLSDRELRDALTAGSSELEQAAGRPIRSLAYPHGDWDERTPAAARDAGFGVAFTTGQHAVAATDDPHSLGRFEAPVDSAAHLAFRLARGLLSRAIAQPYRAA